jgi:hypothetical protein
MGKLFLIGLRSLFGYTCLFLCLGDALCYCFVCTHHALFHPQLYDDDAKFLITYTV